MVRVLIGDIGGTNVRLATVDVPGNGGVEWHSREDMLTSSVPSLAAALEEYLARHPERPHAAVVGIAGPVEGNVCQSANIPWGRIDGKQTAEQLGFAVELLNDFAIAGWGVAALGPDQVRYVGAAKEAFGAQDAVRVVLGPGTGLGESFLTKDAHGWRVFPCEGGWKTASARSPLEQAFLEHLVLWRRSTGSDERISVEFTVAAPALERAYEFMLARTSASPVKLTPAEVTEKASAGDAVAQDAVELWLGFLGAEVSHVGLQFCPSGIYIIGSLAERLEETLVNSAAFRERAYELGHPALNAIAARTPVAVVKHPDIGLLGAGHYASQRYADS